MCDTVVHVLIVQISNTCAPARMCSGAHVLFTGTHTVRMLEIWTIDTCTTSISHMK